MWLSIPITGCLNETVVHHKVFRARNCGVNEVPGRRRPWIIQTDTSYN